MKLILKRILLFTVLSSSLLHSATFDWGDAPDPAAGSSLGNYQTLAADGGPNHEIILAPEMYIGEVGPDAEADAQEHVNALGDDAKEIADEDGVLSDLRFHEGSIPQIEIEVLNKTPGPVTLGVWLDLNVDGKFEESADERVIINVPSDPKAQIFTVNMPNVPSGIAGNSPLGRPSFLRIRLSTNAAAASLATGPAPDGEVEDWEVRFFKPMDYGDLPDANAGSGFNDYQTRLADNGPYHIIDSALTLGAEVDPDVDAFPGADALGDDEDGLDDEDGVMLPHFYRGDTIELEFTVKNETTSDAYLALFADWNGNGSFADSGERWEKNVFPDVGVQVVSLSINVPALTANNVALRVRLSPEIGLGPTGVASKGEVEDYRIQISTQDFGDLPDTGIQSGYKNYQTLLESNGPWHRIVPELYLGDVPPNSEFDGHPSMAADGDAVDEGGLVALVWDWQLAFDDETGFLPGESLFQLRLTQSATNSLGVNAKMIFFLDVNQDGDFTDAGERVAYDVPAGSEGLEIFHTFDMPLDLIAPGTNERYGRIRLSTQAGLLADGGATEGEVEDYLISFEVVTPEEGGPAFELYGVGWFGSLPDTTPETGPGDYQTHPDNGGPTHFLLDSLGLGDFSGEIPGGTTPGPLARGEVANFPVSATNVSGEAGWIYGFVDWNDDGDFEDADEMATVIELPDGTDNGDFIVSMNVPWSAVEEAAVGARFRASNLSHLDALGPGGLGEVEDQFITVSAVYDFGDLPDTGPGTGVDNYRTLRENGGAYHRISPDLFIGVAPDAEYDGQQSADARGDDELGSEDEDFSADGLAPNFQTTIEYDTYYVPIDALTGYFMYRAFYFAEMTNTTGEVAALDIFLDRTGNGQLEYVRTKDIPSDGTYFILELIDLGPASDGANTVAVRSRLNESSLVEPDANGFGGIGEVEDRFYTFQNGYEEEQYLVGSLPDSGPGTGPGNYETAPENGGAAHDKVFETSFFGNLDGPTKDDDGLRIPDTLRRSETNTLRVIATNPDAIDAAYVYAFVDWNQDGDFEDEAESARQDLPSDETNLALDFVFEVPADAPLGDGVGARFRVSDLDSLGANHYGGAGMVVDQLLTLSRSHAEQSLEDWIDVHTLVGADRDYDGNPDGDQRVTMMEYATDGDPNEAADASLGFWLEEVEDEGQSWMEFVYLQRSDAPARGLTYEVRMYDQLEDLDAVLPLQALQTIPRDAAFEEARRRVDRALQSGETSWFGEMRVLFTP